MILEAGTIKRIHVNQHVIRSNTKSGAEEPVISVIEKGRTYRGTIIDITGNSRIIYSPAKPLSCGARVWIETTGMVVID